MKKNLNTLDRVVRIIVAMVIAGLFFANIISGTVAIILLVVAAIFILTSFISFCPIYWAIGISSKKKED